MSPWIIQFQALGGNAYITATSWSTRRGRDRGAAAEGHSICRAAGALYPLHRHVADLPHPEDTIREVKIRTADLGQIGQGEGPDIRRDVTCGAIPQSLRGNSSPRTVHAQA